MFLTSAQCKYLFDLISKDTGQEGWADKQLPDGTNVAAIQGMLSIQKEMALKREARDAETAARLEADLHQS